MYVHLVLVDLSPGSGWRISSESEGGDMILEGSSKLVWRADGRMLVEWEEGDLNGAWGFMA